MTLFKTRVAQDIWLEHWCDRCYRQRDCGILDSALTRDRKPPQWIRPARVELMKDAYRCTEYHAKPPRPKTITTHEEPMMFDVDAPVDRPRYLPVEGWPDRPVKGETDHA
jgi:hypothetical protein